MSKLLVRTAALGLAAAGLLAPGAQAAILGPHAADCAPGADKPAMLVKVTGIKARTGLVRVQSYGGDPEHYFDKGTYLERVEFAPPASGPIEVCLAVPKPGTYAVSVRHNLDGEGSTGMSDGGGFSGNPAMSLMDAIFKRRPSPVQVEIKVAGLTRVPVILNYVQGGTLKPLANAER